jgi:hypothetical protein
MLTPAPPQAASALDRPCVYRCSPRESDTQNVVPILSPVMVTDSGGPDAGAGADTDADPVDLRTHSYLLPDPSPRPHPHPHPFVNPLSSLFPFSSPSRNKRSREDQEASSDDTYTSNTRNRTQINVTTGTGKPAHARGMHPWDHGPSPSPESCDAALLRAVRYVSIMGAGAGIGAPPRI